MAVAGCADSRFGSDPLYTPFGSRSAETTGSVPSNAPPAPVMAAPTTQVSNQPLPPAYYPPAPVQQQTQPYNPSYGQPSYGQPSYGQPSYGQPAYGQSAPQASLPPPPPRWSAPAAPTQSTYVPARANPPQAAYGGRPTTVAAAPAPAYRPPASVAPARIETTGAVPTGNGASDSWNWEGGTAITVKPGESVELLARRYGVPAQAIARANNLSDPRLVHPGQRLVIPTYTYRPGGPDRTSAALSPQATAALRAASPPAAAAPSGTHIVNSGETLNGIAKRYRLTRAELAAANGLTPDARLSVGQRLMIPGRRGASQQAAAATQMPVAQPSLAQPRPETPAPAALAPAAPASVAAAKPEPKVETAAMVKPTVTPEDTVETKSEPARQGLSFRWPVHGRVITGYGAKPGGERNDGINIAVPEGASIKAAEDGVVAYSGAELKGYGNLVLIRHSDGWVTAYAHNSEILVKRGDTVKRGQTISKAGQSGSVTSPQLHFEVRRGSNPVDPMPLLGGG
ncbi:cell division protein FtsH [Blastochloris viridis]|uniref:Cell division protein FtsH n=1 Tax=Blastochloris viridis TaxID=1079 RepID=A0A182D791_BLAVI|nr:cell division protein FtsH [Blastochloris viridis]